MDIKNFKNKYEGQSCVIVGNGSSLNGMDLSKLNGKSTFGLNRISLIYDKKNWKPSFFVSVTSNFNIDDWRNSIMKSVNDPDIISFITMDYNNKIQSEGINIVTDPITLRCTGDGARYKSYPDEFWSNDPSKIVYKYGSSILVPLQLAKYMGFKTIYLIGCDLGFKKYPHNEDGNHFDTNYNTPGCTPDALNYNMVMAHKLAKRMCEKDGIKIYNATEGGDLDVYDRVKFDDIIDKL